MLFRSMTAEKQAKIQKLLDDLKEEIFVELDRRVRDAEEALELQIDQVASSVDNEAVQRRRIFRKVHQEFQDFQKNFSYHRIPYTATIVVGFMLFWYGMWNIFPKITFLDNGFNAMFLGLVLLFLTGATYKKFVG